MQAPPSPPVPPRQPDFKGQHVGNISESVGKARLYGALMDQRLMDQAHEADALISKFRMNILPIFISLLLPWLVFLLSFWTTSFYMHYAAPICTFILLALFCGLPWHFHGRAQKARRGGHEDVFYHSYLAITLTVAIVVGAIVGDCNFWFYTQPVYENEYMAKYYDVDPSSKALWSGEAQAVRGKQYQDAGVVYFNDKVIVDQNRSMSFKMGDLYCAAPIINPDCKKNCGYDFWAVGTNCCSEDGAHFRCGDFANSHTHSGLRLMNEGKRTFFRLAIMEAEGIHHVASPHPIFMHWLLDPVAELNSWRKKAYRIFVISMFCSFFASAISIGTAVAMWAKPAARDPTRGLV